MTSVTGLEFDAAWPNRIMAPFGDVVAPVLGDDLTTSVFMRCFSTARNRSGSGGMPPAFPLKVLLFPGIRSIVCHAPVTDLISRLPRRRCA